MKVQEKYPFLSIEELVAVKDDPQAWIVPGMLPRAGRTIVYGKGGTYKSLIVFDLAVAIASVGKMLEAIPISSYGPVALISTEGTVSSNKRRVLSHLRARNVLPNNTTVRLFYSHQRGRLDQREVFLALDKALEEIRPIMLVLDPFINFFSGNENNANEVNAFTEVIDYFIEKYNISVVIIHHASKKGDLRGSSALWGWGDAIICSTVKRKVKIPGLTAPADILTLTAEKMRDGGEGELFSCVPFISDQVGMVTFGFHQGLDAGGVVVAYLKQAIYLMFRQNQRAMYRQQIVDTMRMSHDSVGRALDWLTMDGLLEPIELRVSTDSQGIRTRGVPGWRLATGGGKVDAASSMLKLIREESDRRLLAI